MLDKAIIVSICFVKKREYYDRINIYSIIDIVLGNCMPIVF